MLLLLLELLELNKNEDPEEKLLLYPDDTDPLLFKPDVFELLLFQPCALELLWDHPLLLVVLLELFEESLELLLELWLLVQLYICGVGDIFREIQINLSNG